MVSLSKNIFASGRVVSFSLLSGMLLLECVCLRVSFWLTVIWNKSSLWWLVLFYSFQKSARLTCCATLSGYNEWFVAALNWKFFGEKISSKRETFFHFHDFHRHFYSRIRDLYWALVSFHFYNSKKWKLVKLTFFTMKYDENIYNHIIISSKMLIN